MRTRRRPPPARPAARQGSRRMLELRSVDAGYGSFQALFGVSLDVKAGEAVGVIGPNGAGKTTLMRVISGLIRPVQGLHRDGRHRCAGDAAASHRQPRHCPCAGKPPAVSAPHRRRQSEDGRLHAGRPCQICRAAGIRVRSVPAHEGAASPDGRHPVGRRAADVRDRPRADVPSKAAAARRAFRRALRRSSCSRCSSWSNASAPPGSPC